MTLGPADYNFRRPRWTKFLLFGSGRAYKMQNICSTSLFEMLDFERILSTQNRYSNQDKWGTREKKMHFDFGVLEMHLKNDKLKRKS